MGIGRRFVIEPFFATVLGLLSGAFAMYLGAPNAGAILCTFVSLRYLQLCDKSFRLSK